MSIRKNKLSNFHARDSAHGNLLKRCQFEERSSIQICRCLLPSFPALSQDVANTPPIRVNTDRYGLIRKSSRGQSWVTLRSRVCEKQKNAPNSAKTRASGPTGFNMNPKGQSRPWGVQETWFCEIDVLKTKKHP